jgi:ribosomal protein L7/L12
MDTKINPFYLAGRLAAYVTREFNAGKAHTTQVSHLVEIGVLLRNGALGQTPGSITTPNTNYVRAIKHYREATHADLLTAKTAVDDMLRKMNLYWRA